MSASMAFYATDTTRVRLNTYGTRRSPILALDGSDHTLTISCFETVPIADHLAFARALATAAATYVTALETYATAQPDGTDTTDTKPRGDR